MITVSGDSIVVRAAIIGGSAGQRLAIFHLDAAEINGGKVISAAVAGVMRCKGKTREY